MFILVFTRSFVKILIEKDLVETYFYLFTVQMSELAYGPLDIDWLPEPIDKTT